MAVVFWSVGLTVSEKIRKPILRSRMDLGELAWRVSNLVSHAHKRASTKKEAWNNQIDRMSQLSDDTQPGLSLANSRLLSELMDTLIMVAGVEAVQGHGSMDFCSPQLVYLPCCWTSICPPLINSTAINIFVLLSRYLYTSLIVCFCFCYWKQVCPLHGSLHAQGWM